MAGYNQKLEDALIAAHEAGDTEGAQAIADELKKWQPKATKQPDPSLLQQAGAVARDIPRQLGLATRYGLQGLADTAGIVTDPLAYGVNKVITTANAPTMSDLVAGNKPYQFQTLRGATEGLLDSAGFPSPQTPDERTVGTASELLAGTGGLIGGASSKAAQRLPEVARNVMQSIAARPGYQASSAIGAGLSAGSAKEAGAGPAGQFGASLVGGLGLPIAVSGIDSIANRAGAAIKDFMTPQIINIQVQNAIKNAGVTLDGLPNSVRNSIMEDVKTALRTGQEVSPDALRRLADYRAVGATPMRSSLTLNPSDVTRERNLAKLSANSRDSAAQTLSNLQNENNATLIRNLNEMGADTADDAVAAGQKIIGELSARNSRVEGVINKLYQNARDTEGRSAMLDPSAFSNRWNDLIDENNLGDMLATHHGGLVKKLNKISSGETPLTVDVAESLKSSIYSLQKKEPNGNVKTALGFIRQALDETPLSPQYHGMNPNDLPMPYGTVPPSGMELGEESIKAFNTARNTNRKWMNIVDRTPALQAVRDGVEPDKFVQQFVIGNGPKSNLMDVARLKSGIKGSKEAQDAVRGQILSHLKGRGVSGAADEVANFSPANYNKALSAIGERKLNLFFNKDEVEQLKRIGRVASYEKFQPTGSAVNNSNTAAALFTSVIDRIAGSNVVRSIPFGEAAISGPATNISVNIGARKTLNAPNALLRSPQKQQMPIPLWPLLRPFPPEQERNNN
jgi:hypothetical protein